MRTDVDGGGPAPLPMDWSRYSFPAIAAMFGNSVDTVSPAQVLAWQKQAALCQDQADALEQGLAKLQERWPAVPGGASAGLGEVVGELAAAMRHDAEVAAGNAKALRGIIDELDHAKQALSELAEQMVGWALQSVKDNEHAAVLAAEAGGVAAVAVTTEDWQARSDREAQAIMRDADVNVFYHALGLQIPQSFDLRRDRSVPIDGGDSDSGGSGSAPLVAPLVYDPPSLADYRPPAVAPDSATSGSVLRDAGAAGSSALDDPVLASGLSDFGAYAAGGAGLPVDSGLGMVVSPISSAVGGSAALSARAGTPSAAGGTTSDSVLGGRMPFAPSMMAPPAGGKAGVRPGGRMVRPGQRRRYDPDDPWRVEEGGPSILEAEPEPDPSSFDPGPGVFGIDR